MTENEPVTVRNLRPVDLARVIDLDWRITGNRRSEYFKLKLSEALADTGVQISLAAEYDDQFAGFLLARVYFGEFGAAERTAVLDTIGVHPGMRGHGVARALLRQLRQNLQALGIESLQTEVSWDDQELLSFFHCAGFRPGLRLCLDLDLQAARAAEERRAEVMQPG